MPIKKLSLWLAPLFIGAMVGLSATARADDDGDKEAPKNLKVLAKDMGKALGGGMKAFSKGLGVECKACHVKGKFAADDVAAKDVARKFFSETVGEKDKAKRDAALKPLLEALKLEKVKNDAKLWEGVEMWKKQ